MLRELIPKTVRRMGRTSFNSLTNTYLKYGHRIGFLDIDDIYDDEFHQMMTNPVWKRDAEQVVSILDKYLCPDSIIDLGCSVGLHCAAFAKRGVSIHGVDGSEAALQNSVISNKLIEHHDLREEYRPQEKYDLCLCFEVAEHLHETHADTLVKSISNCSDKVAFTAASPGQGGRHHVNEQPAQFWDKKMRAHDFRRHTDLTTSIRSEIDVEKTVWIPENLTIYMRH